MSSIKKQAFGLETAVQRACPYLALLDKGHHTAAGHHRRITRGNSHWRAATNCHGPDRDCLLFSTGCGIGFQVVCRRPVCLVISATDVQQMPTVRSKSKL